MLSRHAFFPPTVRCWQGLVMVLVCLFAGLAHGENAQLRELMLRGEGHERKQETRQAIEIYLAAEKLAPDDAEVLVRLAKQHSDLIFESKDKAEQKRLAEKCLAYARKSVALSPDNARAQLAVAACLAKNFPYADNQTKVNYSREVKERTERAIQIDPKQDLAYHMLGRWHYEVADMNFVLKGLMKLLYGGLPKGTNEEALKYFEKAAELAPRRIIHRLELAKVQLRLSKKGEAIATLKEALVMVPTDKDDVDAREDVREKLRKLGVR